MEQRGKLVIVLMIAMAIGMAGYAWWHQRQSGRRSTEFWGTQSALVVRYGPTVEFLPLQPKSAVQDEDSRGTTQLICGREYQVGEPVDITRTRGLVHARHALVDDLSYDWTAPKMENTEWEFLLRFRDKDRSVAAAFDAERGLVCALDQSQVQQFIPKIATAFRQKREEWRKVQKVEGRESRD